MISIVLFLMAISQVETGGNAAVIGKAGERSAYQMTEQTWHRYTSDPFVWATSRPWEARRVALEHARWVESVTIHHQAPNQVYWMAHLWNPGAPADYARRVEHLYRDLERQANPPSR